MRTHPGPGLLLALSLALPLSAQMTMTGAAPEATIIIWSILATAGR